MDLQTFGYVESETVEKLVTYWFISDINKLINTQYEC